MTVLNLAEGRQSRLAAVITRASGPNGVQGCDVTPISKLYHL